MKVEVVNKHTKEIIRYNLVFLIVDGKDSDWLDDNCFKILYDGVKGCVYDKNDYYYNIIR